ncbi:hypothetical protein [Algoriphagus resistens]|uniref:hypothetical protein n=1 Tax=Algoriphagus resistens TaxID=1750590 RepID=UPI000716B7DC|nr:hypothetical protein [Algoriphagus resistens]
MDEKTPVPKRKVNVSLLIGIAAIFLSASALLVSIIQTTILKEQQQASVWPYIQATFMFTKGYYSFGIENKGVGPAIIKDLEYAYIGTNYDNTKKMYAALFGESYSGVGFTETNKNYVIKSGEGIEMLSVNLPDSLINGIITLWESDAVNLIITYSDVYGNCWKLDNGVTTRLSSCPD